MCPGFNGVLLRGQPKSVPAHRMQDVEPLRTLGSGNNIAASVSFGVADVQTSPRRIGKHVERVEFGLRQIGAGAERVIALPN